MFGLGASLTTSSFFFTFPPSAHVPLVMPNLGNMQHVTSIKEGLVFPVKENVTYLVEEPDMMRKASLTLLTQGP